MWLWSTSRCGIRLSARWVGYLSQVMHDWRVSGRRWWAAGFVPLLCSSFSQGSYLLFSRQTLFLLCMCYPCCWFFGLLPHPILRHINLVSKSYYAAAHSQLIKTLFKNGTTRKCWVFRPLSFLRLMPRPQPCFKMALPVIASVVILTFGVHSQLINYS